MLLSTAIFVMLCVHQDAGDTYGKTNAQIVAMGRSRWYDFYTGKAGDSTAAMSGAEGLYGDALAWRNDRLGKARTGRLRKILQDTKNDAIGVGSALTGGGTMWNITSGSLYATAEETLYLVVTKSARGPKRVVSDVEKAYGKLRVSFKKAEFIDGQAKLGAEAMARLRRDLDRVYAEAKRQPRRESDALLDFCLRSLAAAEA